LHRIEQGVENTERIGSKINIESFNIHAWIGILGQAKNDTDVYIDRPMIRYGVFYDRQPPTDVFAARPNVIGDVFTSFWGHINKDNKDRFFVISDKFTKFGSFHNLKGDIIDPGEPPLIPPTFGPPTTFWTEPRDFIWKEYKDVDLSVTYANNDVLGLEPLSGALWVFVLQSPETTATATDALNITWDIRTTFTESF